MAFNSSMPMFWGDYLRDTRALSPAEHGAYLLLIAEQWNTTEPLPDDDSVLARIVGMTPREWRSARRAVEPYFDVRDGVWIQRRVEKELNKARETYEKRSAAGSRGGSRAKAKPKPGLWKDEAGNNQPKPEPKPKPLSASSLGSGYGGLSPRETFISACWEKTKCDPDRHPFTEVAFGQWFSEGCTVEDIEGIPAILERERIREGDPSMIKPPGYYTTAVRRARMQRQSGAKSGDDLRSEIDAAWEKISAA